MKIAAMQMLRCFDADGPMEMGRWRWEMGETIYQETVDVQKANMSWAAEADSRYSASALQW